MSNLVQLPPAANQFGSGGVCTITVNQSRSSPQRGTGTTTTDLRKGSEAQAHLSCPGCLIRLQCHGTDNQVPNDLGCHLVSRYFIGICNRHAARSN